MSPRPTGHLRIAQTGKHTTVELDGQDISERLCGLHLEFRPRQLPDAQFDVNAHEVRILGVATLRVPDETRELLIRFGWTPPADEHDGPADERPEEPPAGEGTGE